MKHLLPVGLILALSVLVPGAAAAPTEDQVKAKEALKELQDYIGGWKGSGQDKAAPRPSDPVWDETVQWAWKFKGDDAWLTLTFKDSKLYKSAELRYLVPKKLYQLTATTRDGKKLVYQGKLEDDKLLLKRTDPDTREVEQLKMNLAAEGVRFVYRVERRKEGGTINRFVYQFAATKIGESLGKKEKKNECVVSGGVGTMTVTYNGETFYVCCSGCAEEFKANPKKYVDEYKKKKGLK